MKYERQRSDWNGSRNSNWKGDELEYTCLQCGSTFRRLGQNREHKYCSHDCYNAARASTKPARTPLAEMRGSKHPRYTGDKFCKVCGKLLEGRDQRKRGYCSDECKSNRRKRDFSGEKNPRYTKGVHVYCRVCGVEITHRSRLSVQFCSRKCSAKWQSIHYSGVNSPIYKPDADRRSYPPEFNLTLRMSIRRRDKFCCRICGVYQKGRGKALDVHHIDGGRDNNSPDNLISLCRKCHLKVHSYMRRTGEIYPFDKLPDLGGHDHE